MEEAYNNNDRCFRNLYDLGLTQRAKVTPTSSTKFMMIIPKASPEVRKKLVACSSSSNLKGGVTLESSIKNSNKLGINPQLAIDRSLKKDLRISGIGTDMNTIRLIICITSTSPQKCAGFKKAPPPPDPPLDAPDTTEDVKPIAPAL